MTGLELRERFVDSTVGGEAYIHVELSVHSDLLWLIRDGRKWGGCSVPIYLCTSHTARLTTKPINIRVASSGVVNV